MQAMVLAAGLGTRLWPLTADRAKPAVPFLGEPLIRGVLDLLAAHGISRAVINTHHRPESVRRAVEGFDSPMAIAFSHEERILGTAGSIAKAILERRLDPDAPMLVINAKLYTDIDLSRVIEQHAALGAAVTMVLRPNVEREHFREVLVEGTRVAGFGEEAVPSSLRPLLFTGIHVLEPEVIRTIPLAFSDTVRDVYPPFLRAGRIAAHVAEGGRWWEFSTLERYLDLHHRAAREGLGPGVVSSRGARIHPGAEVLRSVLWEDAEVREGAYVADSVLGRGVVIDAGERVERAVVVRRAIAGDPPPERATLWGERLMVPLLTWPRTDESIGPASGP